MSRAGRPTGYGKPPLCLANLHLPPYGRAVLFTIVYRSPHEASTSDPAAGASHHLQQHTDRVVIFHHLCSVTLIANIPSLGKSIYGPHNLFFFLLQLTLSFILLLNLTSLHQKFPTHAGTCALVVIKSSLNLLGNKPLTESTEAQARQALLTSCHTRPFSRHFLRKSIKKCTALKECNYISSLPGNTITSFRLQRHPILQLTQEIGNHGHQVGDAGSANGSPDVLLQWRNCSALHRSPGCNRAPLSANPIDRKLVLTTDAFSNALFQLM